MASPNRILREARTTNFYNCQCGYVGSMVFQEVQHKSGVFDTIRCPSCGAKIFEPTPTPEKRSDHRDH